MKHYCVTYYDGKGERQMYVQAKSINAAKAAANDLLRKNKTIGASVRKAERITKTEYVNAIDRFKLRQAGLSSLIGDFDLLCGYCIVTKQMMAKQSKSKPFRASEVARIIKERR